MNPTLQFTKKYMLPYLLWYLLGFACVLATQFTMVTIIEETREALDVQDELDYGENERPEAVTADGQVSPSLDEVTDDKQWQTGRQNIVLPYVYKILGLAFFLFFIRTISRYLVFTPGRMIEFTIRNHFFQTLMNKPRSFFRSFETGDLISRASNDIGFIRAAFGYGVLQVVNVISAFAFGIWGMWRMDPKTTMWIGIPMFSTLILIQLSIRYLFNHWRLANEQLGHLSSYCLASFQGVSAIQGYHAEPRFIHMFTKKSQEYLDTNLLITSIRSFVMPLVKFSGNIATFVVLWVIGSSIIRGEHSIGHISAYLGYIAMVMPPLLSLGWMMNVFNRAVPAMERLGEIIGNFSDETAEKLCAPDGVVNHMLEVRNLGVGFEKGENGFKLEDISFTLKSGKSLGIVGEVGSGKTVLVEALLKFNPLANGEILFDGRLVGSAGHVTDYAKPASSERQENETHSEIESIACHRRRFSFASQRAFLFSTSLRENLLLALGNGSGNEPALSDQDLLKALEMAGFNLDKSHFPKGLDTQVGEKGIMLSGGQRQRIALARCFLKDAAFYILDDVLSAVDHETQRTILRNLKTLSDSKSYLIVSHRISAVQWCDEILVLENGRIIDRGTHDELLARPGYYQASYNYQTTAEEQ